MVIFAWVIISNHIHLVAKAKEGYQLSDIIRNFKKFTDKKIIKNIQEINESRKVWMLKQFEYAGNRIKRNGRYKFWKDDNHAILLYNNHLIEQKIAYIHANPVNSMLVDQAAHHIFSSARDYGEEKGLVAIEIMS